MADFNPIGEHDKPDEGTGEKPDENILLKLRGVIEEGPTSEPGQE